MFIGVLASVSVALSILYACTKPANPETAVQTNHIASTQTAQRSAGVVTYYSKHTNGTVYKMVLTTSSSGIVSVNRTVYSTTRPDTIKTKVFAGEDVVFHNYKFNPDSNKYYGDTIRISVPNNKTYYVIPFVPGKDIATRPGGSGFQCYCQCGCSDPAQCAWCLENGSGSEMECLGLCESCYSMSNGCPDVIGWGRVSNCGGFAIIDANGYNVIN